jgi:hypothetical protein
MKSIFVINDNSPQAVHAVEFALAIAQKMQANILLALACKEAEINFEEAKDFVSAALEIKEKVV